MDSNTIFVPGLLEVLRAAIPPTVAYFKTLQLPLGKFWARSMALTEQVTIFDNFSGLNNPINTRRVGQPVGVSLAQLAGDYNSIFF